MTEAEIEELIDAFVQAARRDKESGFDGTDLFAGYNCLIDQFWSPLTNKRDDQWGGSLENRLRFTARVCEGIRKVNGDDFIIGMTISGAEPYPGGLTMEDKQEIVAWLDERTLVDYYSCGTGSYLNQFSLIVPSFHFDMMLGPPDAAQFKQVVKHARITAEARVKTPANADKVIGEGSSDMVSMVRSQIADPHLANKARDGRIEDIRPCISCNQLCLGRRLRDYHISCLVNPSVSREHEWGGDTVPRSDNPREVLVVGGGPGGLEAARVAAERGHQVRLVERTGELGGQFRLAAGQPERGEVGQYLNWAQGQLQKLQVRIDLRTEVSAEDIENGSADAVILCTGSTPDRTGFQRAYPHVSELPGADQDNVCTVHDVLDGSVVPGTNVLLLDDINGWLPASGTAVHLAKQRHYVTVATASEKAAGQMDYSHTGDTMRERFAKFGIEVLLATAVESWSGNTARLVNLYTGDIEEREFDSLVLASTNRVEDSLTRALAGADKEVHTIGDAVQARTAAMAIYEARRLAMAI